MPKLLPFVANKMDLGLNLQTEHNLELGEIAGGESARFVNGAGIYTGPGFRKAGDLGTSSSVNPLQEATVFPALWAKSGTTIQFSENPDGGEFYAVQASPTSTEGGWFQEQGNGDMFYINQVDDPLRIAVGRNTSAIADTDTTITVGADWINKFATSGTVYIRGDAITYSGVNATQLTGVSGIQSGGHPVNSLVIQTSNPSTFGSAYNGTFAFEMESRLITGGRLHYENILSASGPEDATHPQYFYDFTGNGAVQKVMAGRLTGGIRGIGRAYLFTDNQCFQFRGFDTTTNGFLIDQLSQNYGAYNQRCIVDMEGTIAFLGQRRLIPIDIQLAASGTSQPAFGEKFDQKIRPWLNELDDDQSHARLDYNKNTKILKISAVRNGALETYIYDRSSGVFGPKEIRSVACYGKFQGRTYFGHVSNGLVYKDDEGRTNDGLPIVHRWITGLISYDKGRSYIQGYTFTYHGVMTIGCEHTLNIYVDESPIPVFSQNYDDSLIVSTVGSPLGSRGIGQTVVGSSSPSDGTMAYTFYNTILLAGLSGEHFQFEWITQKEGVFLQVEDFDFRAYLIRNNQRTRT